MVDLQLPTYLLDDRAKLLVVALRVLDSGSLGSMSPYSVEPVSAARCGSGRRLGLLPITAARGGRRWSRGWCWSGLTTVTARRSSGLLVGLVLVVLKNNEGM